MKSALSLYQGLVRDITRCGSLVLLCLAIMGCKPGEWKDTIDIKWFEHMGETLFDDAHSLTTKELHLDSGALLGHQIIFEGELVSKGEYDTYILMRDTAGRMLVVLTQVVDAEKTLAEPSPQRLKVLGTVERGKKGLPYILAKAVTTANTAKDSPPQPTGAFVAPVPSDIPELMNSASPQVPEPSKDVASGAAGGKADVSTGTAN